MEYWCLVLTLSPIKYIKSFGAILYFQTFLRTKRKLFLNDVLVDPYFELAVVIPCFSTDPDKCQL